ASPGSPAPARRARGRPEAWAVGRRKDRIPGPARRRSRSRGAPRGYSLREDAALAVAVLQALEANRVARGAPVGLVACNVVANAGPGLLHPALQPVEHVLQVPLLGALVLQPLVVRDDHAARVAQDVRDDVDALAEQDVLGLGIGRAVGALD